LEEGEGFWVSYSVSSLYLTVSHSLVQSPCVSRQERVKGRTGKKENREERRRAVSAEDKNRKVKRRTSLLC
jgi:hypothetical protein